MLLWVGPQIQAMLRSELTDRPSLSRPIAASRPRQMPLSRIPRKLPFVSLRRTDPAGMVAMRGRSRRLLMSQRAMHPCCQTYSLGGERPDGGAATHLRQALESSPPRSEAL